MTRCPPRVRCRGVIPPLAHTMLQSDTLANEFAEILNLVEIFSRFQPLDPAVIFSAPLRNSTRDLRLNPDSFERLSDALWQDAQGQWRSATENQARYENGQLLKEPAATNKLEVHNAAPDGSLTGWDPFTGGSTEIFQEIDDTQAIIDSGLGEICSGRVYELDNRTGSITAFGRVLAQNVGNLNPHNASCFAYALQGNCFAGIESDSPKTQNFAISNTYDRYTTTVTPTSTSRRWLCAADPGGWCRFILPQLEEAPVVSSPIITQGAAGQRARDDCFWDLPAFNQQQGMAMIGVRVFFSDSDWENNNAENLIAVSDERYSLLYGRSPVGTPSKVISRMANLTTAQTIDLAYSSGDLFHFAVRWNRPASQFQVGHAVNGVWTWGTEVVAALDDFAVGQYLHLAFNQHLVPLRFSDMVLYDADYGRAWIEANYP